MNPRRKRKGQLLFIDYSCLSNTEVMLTIDVIERKIKSIMKHHIGSDNSISPNELFMKIYGIDPQKIDIFKRMYWWSVAKRIMGKLRVSGQVFIINKGSKLFVLETQQELNEFKLKVDQQISNLKVLKKQADIWVRYKRYKHFVKEV